MGFLPGAYDRIEHKAAVGLAAWVLFPLQSVKVQELLKVKAAQRQLIL